MQLHNISPTHAGRTARRIGRGGKRGTYSGKGIKGQNSRAGAKKRPEERELLKKIPKLRGYRFKSFRTQPTAINIDDIARKFAEGDLITPETLVEAGLINRVKGRLPAVKILGRGDVKTKFVLKDVTFSKSVVKNQK